MSVLFWVPLLFLAGMLAYRFLLKAIIPGGELNTLLYTAGLSLLIANLALFVWTGDYRTLNLPYAIEPLRPFGIAVPVPLAIAFALAALITVALYLFLARTDTGRAMRATSQNPEAAALMGINVERIAMITFGLGTALAAAAGVLLVPSLYLYPTVGEILIVKCFVIVVLGGLGSVPGAIAGGVLLGRGRIARRGVRVGGVQGHDRLRHVPAGAAVPPAGPVRDGTVMKRALPVAAALLLLALPLARLEPVPPAPRHHRADVDASSASAWNLLGGYAGQVSFGHAAFFGVGAYTTMILYLSFGLAPWYGMVLGGAVGALVSLPIGLICFRLRGPYFSLATLAVAEIVRLVALNWEALTNGPVGLLITSLPQVTLFGAGRSNWETQGAVLPHRRGPCAVRDAGRRSC